MMVLVVVLTHLTAGVSNLAYFTLWIKNTLFTFVSMQNNKYGLLEVEYVPGVVLRVGRFRIRNRVWQAIVS